MEETKRNKGITMVSIFILISVAVRIIINPHLNTIRAVDILQIFTGGIAFGVLLMTVISSMKKK